MVQKQPRKGPIAQSRQRFQTARAEKLTAAEAAAAERGAAARGALRTMRREEPSAVKKENRNHINSYLKLLVEQANERAAGNGGSRVPRLANSLTNQMDKMHISNGGGAAYHRGVAVASTRGKLPANSASIDITLSKNVLERLRALHTESSNVIPANGGDGVEYAGIIKLQNQKTTSNFMPAALMIRSFRRGSGVPAILPVEYLNNAVNITGTVTNNASLVVTPSQEIVDSRITFHTHPTPRWRKGQTEYKKDTHAFTMPPSIGDLEFYLNNWPKTQANIIVDEFGFYVVDVMETESQGMYMTTKGTVAFQMRVKIICKLWYTVFFSNPTEGEVNLDDVKTAIRRWWPDSIEQVVNKSINAIRDMEKYTRSARVPFGAAQGLLFAKSEVKEYNEQLMIFSKITGVSVKYYINEQIARVNELSEQRVAKENLPTVTLTSRKMLIDLMELEKEMTQSENKSQQVA